jgi:hypothetical protein
MITTLFLSVLSVSSEPAPMFSTVDVDHDGRPDLCELRSDGSLLLVGTDSGGRLVDRTVELGLDRVPPAARTEWRDVDVDGWVDLIVQTETGSLHIYHNARGTVFEVQPLFTGTPETPPVGWQWMHFDTDDRFDLVVRTETSIHLLIATQDGSFQESSSLAVDREASGSDRTGLAVPAADGPLADLDARSLIPTEGPVNLDRAGPRRAHPEEEGTGERAQPGRRVPGVSTSPPPSPLTLPSDQTVEFVAGAAAPVVDGCAMSVRDAATTECVSASSIPLLGALYPLGTELFIDPDGRVSLGTTSPSPARLTVLADSAPGGTGDCVHIETPVGSATALHAISSSNSDGVGVRAEANSQFGRAVRGVNNSTFGKSIALEGVSRSPDAQAIFGYATSTTGSATAVLGQSEALDGIAIFGDAKGLGGAVGVLGETQAMSRNAAGVVGAVDGDIGEASGVWGIVESADAVAVRATHVGDTFGSPIACFGEAEAPNGVGVLGTCSGIKGVGTQGQVPLNGIGVFGVSNTAMLPPDPIPFVPVLFTGVGVLGLDLSPTEHVNGVFGAVESTHSGATGVLGVSSSGAGPGVQGLNRSGLASAYGVAGHVSAPGPSAAGVRGEAGSVSATANGIGVSGIHFGSGVGVSGECEDGTGVFARSVTGFALQALGDTSVLGDLDVTGVKNFVHPHPTDPSKEIRFTCLEGNESGTYFRGSGELRGGRATIKVPEDFLLVSEAEGLTVHVTPIGNPTVIWVESQDLTSIVVRGEPDTGFNYIVNGVRAGFADTETIVDNRHYVPIFDDLSFNAALRPSQRAALIKSGVLRPDGMPDKQTAARLGWVLKAATPAACPEDWAILAPPPFGPRSETHSVSSTTANATTAKTAVRTTDPCREPNQ